MAYGHWTIPSLLSVLTLVAMQPFAGGAGWMGGVERVGGAEQATRALTPRVFRERSPGLGWQWNDFADPFGIIAGGAARRA